MERIEVSSSFENRDGSKSIFQRCVMGLISSFTILNVHHGGLGEKGRNDKGSGTQGSSQIRMVVPLPTCQRYPILSTFLAAHILFQQYEEIGCKGASKNCSFGKYFAFSIVATNEHKSISTLALLASKIECI